MPKIFNKKELKGLRRIHRNNMPKAEVVLWTILKGKQMDGYKFRRQHSVENFILDFYCPKLRLGIEVDGPSHFKTGAKEKDDKRQKIIESHKIKILRFTNLDIYENLEGVYSKIWEEIQKISGNRDEPPLAPP